ncbi:hypothetical protein [Bradyrhizobium sp. AT1]|uniref:hypothetical protein n=1 Tax=Bradyrhizobium sp. AT1 TaxID=574934 RepID=UPI0007ABE5FB|nr:hypothetical protein [Bradyrhizobium sp. AT1]
MIENNCLDLQRIACECMARDNSCDLLVHGVSTLRAASVDLPDLQNYLDDHNKEVHSGSERGLVLFAFPTWTTFLKSYFQASCLQRKGAEFLLFEDHRRAQVGLITDCEKVKVEAMRRLRNSLATSSESPFVG